MTVVPDASVILKWILPEETEPHAAKARALRDRYINGDCELLVPALWLFEVGNIVTRKFPAQAQTILDELCALELPVARHDSAWRAKAVGLAKRFGVTFYDASYHAVAIMTQGMLVSADAKYLRRAHRAGHCGFIGDWMPP